MALTAISLRRNRASRAWPLSMNDFGLGYVGHAEHWDKADIAGSLEGRDCAITYRRAGRKLAVAVVHRDLEGLRAEVEFEQVIARDSASGRTVKSAAAPAQQAQTGIGGS